MRGESLTLYLDHITKFRVEQFKKLEGISFSAAACDLIKRGWDHAIEQKVEAAAPGLKRS